MDKQFDELSKSLAEGVPRREALRKIGLGFTLLSLLAAGIGAPSASPAGATTLVVTNVNDNAAGSLRDTITKAKSGDTIVFAPGLDGQTIMLTSDQVTIKNSIDIEGPDASLLAISGNDTNRTFNINTWLNVTIVGLTLTHGRAVGGNSAPTGAGGGGGILNVGSTLTLAKDVFSENVSRQQL